MYIRVLTFCVYVRDVVMSAITYAELESGVAAAANPERERANLASLIEDIPVAPFDATARVVGGQIRMATRESRKDRLDKLIAAHAVALGDTVVTNTTKDFARYPGVMTENWLMPATRQQ